MKLKISILAALAAIAFPVAAQAQDTNGYDSLNVSCESGAECSDFGVNFQEQGDTVAQTRRTRTRRTRSSNDSKIYVGGTLGLFLPGEIDDYEVEVEDTFQQVDPGTGFGGSLYGGYKFTDLISVDAEGLLYFGNADPLDGSYTSLGFFVNPRFTYTLDKTNDKSIYLFASPGIGIGNINFGGDTGDLLEEEEDIDDSGTGFAIQGKVGAGYPITEKLDIIGQARYTNIFSVVDVPEVAADGQLTGESDSKSLGTFGIELGVNYDL